MADFFCVLSLIYTMYMTEYELLYLIGESKEVDTARITKEVKAIVEVEGGTYSGAEKLEKRKLAYAIKREVRGTYIAQRFTTLDKNARELSVEAGEPSVIGRINHKLNLYRDILRFIIVRAENLPALTQEEEGASKIVSDVVKETQKVVEKKVVRKTPAATKSDVASSPVAKEEVKAETKTEAELDKQLEEVLHI